MSIVSTYTLDRFVVEANVWAQVSVIKYLESQCDYPGLDNAKRDYKVQISLVPYSTSSQFARADDIDEVQSTDDFPHYDIESHNFSQCVNCVIASEPIKKKTCPKSGDARFPLVQPFTKALHLCSEKHDSPCVDIVFYKPNGTRPVFTCPLEMG